MFSRVCHRLSHCIPALGLSRLYVFPRLASIAYFSAVGIGSMFPRAWRRLHIFSRLTSVACFPARCIGCMFPRVWYRLHVSPRLSSVACFPRLSSVACFPTLGVGCVLSRPWLRLHVFRSWRRLHIFPSLASVTCFFRSWRCRLVACFPRLASVLITSNSLCARASLNNKGSSVTLTSK